MPFYLRHVTYDVVQFGGTDLLLFGREEDARSESNALRLDDTLNDIGIAGASEASPTKATLWVHQAPPQRQRSYYDLGFLLCGCC
eukprot:m.233992 g.233992  ORF g.233992 m.233992 type:complete len:85 (+) comp18911_c0_seq5:56-310(+)